MELEVAFEPYRKMSFKSYMKYEKPEELVRTITASIPPGVPAQSTLKWANGVLLTFANFQPADSVIKEYVAGHLLWDHVDFAPMPQYAPEIAVPEKPMVRVIVVDVSRHSLFGPVTEWIRDNLLEKETATSPKVQLNPSEAEG